MIHRCWARRLKALGLSDPRSCIGRREEPILKSMYAVIYMCSYPPIKKCDDDGDDDDDDDDTRQVGKTMLS